MGIFQSIFSQDKTLSAELKSALQANFTKQDGLYRKKDGSLPRLKEFLNLGFDADQYSNLVYGISQKSLQNQLLVPAKLGRVNKRNRIDKLLAEKFGVSSNYPQFCDGLEGLGCNNWNSIDYLDKYAMYGSPSPMVNVALGRDLYL